MQQTPVRIGGRPETLPEGHQILNPFNSEVVGKVPACGEQEVDRACKAAAAALARRDFPQHERARVLERVAEMLRERGEELARIIMREGGKPIATARGEVTRCVDTAVFSAVEARKLDGVMTPAEASAPGEGKVAFSLRVPVGVVAAITPFNFPLNLAAHKLLPAIAAGCPVVLKPAPQTPLAGITLVEWLVEAGMPEDWISVVTDSGKEAGAPLVSHDIPALVSFTGSAPVGWSNAAQAPRKRVCLELGANSPLIVEPDADLDRIVEKLKVAGFANAGQSCISVQRVLVHRDCHAALREKLAAAAESLVCGDPVDEKTQVGPLIRPAENDRVREWLNEALEGGGTLVAGGDMEGSVWKPTVVDEPPQDCRLYRAEAFAPVVTINAYDDFDQGLAMANDSDFGLHAGVFTNALDKALKASRDLDFGGVLINEVPTVRLDQQPYGGVRDAGNTREGPAFAVEEMTELRYISLQP